MYLYLAEQNTFQTGKGNKTVQEDSYNCSRRSQFSPQQLGKKENIKGSTTIKVGTIQCPEQMDWHVQEEK